MGASGLKRTDVLVALGGDDGEPRDLRIPLGGVGELEGFSLSPTLWLRRRMVASGPSGAHWAEGADALVGGGDEDSCATE